MINLNKGISTPLAIIIIILAVLVGGGILIYQYWWMPKGEVKDETANWKTYRNEKYGFEFKYPKEYDECGLCKIKETNNGIEMGEGRFGIEILESEDLSLIDYVNKFVNEQKKELGILELSEEELAERNLGIKTEEIFMGNNKGFEVTLPGRPNFRIFLSKDDKIYQIFWGARGVTGCLGYAQEGAPGYEECKGDHSEAPSELEVFEQIPSTFRFY